MVQFIHRDSWESWAFAGIGPFVLAKPWEILVIQVLFLWTRKFWIETCNANSLRSITPTCLRCSLECSGSNSNFETQNPCERTIDAPKIQLSIDILQCKVPGAAKFDTSEVQFWIVQTPNLHRQVSHQWSIETDRMERMTIEPISCKKDRISRSEQF